MRLKSIKLAGFKSFVDPTTVEFPSNLCSVVGPNGCGKSNIIDAVRWVMGESSAKNLRGESMADVIFNGSNARKPVGQASIELVFDNSDGTLKGEYASFTEIAIKRRVTRDGKNDYFLNGSKCRRRDITDIFLGTGLGPRSYAIIEQGMISRLIDAKPEELRVYIEEAAGISKYKERRRDTENRMRRTTENLERLTDIREELDRQLTRLERQAKSAEKYAEFKQRERDLKAQLLTLKYKVLSEQDELKKLSVQSLEVTVESFVTERVNIESSIEKSRIEHSTYSDTFNEIQSRFYSLGTDIARIEQSIQFAQERASQLQSELEQNIRETQEAQGNLLNDREKATNLDEELSDIVPELERLSATDDDSATALSEAEQAMSEWQQQWDSFNERAAEPKRKAEVEQSRIQHLEHVLSRLHERINRLEQENQALDQHGVNEELGLLTEQLAEFDMEATAKREAIEEINETVTALRQSIANDEEVLNERRSEQQSLKGRCASLEALQQAALGSSESTIEWLEQQTLTNNPRLADALVVEPRWQKAVEIALGYDLQAVQLDDFSSIESGLASFTQGQMTLTNNTNVTEPQPAHTAKPLTDFINQDSAARPLLANIYTASTLSEALDFAKMLHPGESVITQDGLWLGANWIRINKEQDSTHGVLARREELEKGVVELEQIEAQVNDLKEAIAKAKAALSRAETDREQYRREVDESNKRYSELRSQVSAKRARIEQQSVRLEQTQSEIADAREQMAIETENLSQSRMTLELAIDQMDQDTQARETLEAQRSNVKATLDDLRGSANQNKDRYHSLAMQHQAVQTQRSSLQESIARLQSQVERLQSKRELLEAQMGDAHDPDEEQSLELDALLEKRLTVEADLSSARDALESTDKSMRELEQSRSRVEQDIQAHRAKLEQQRLEAKTLQVQREAVTQQMADQSFELNECLANLPDDITESSLDGELNIIGKKIDRLGPINLAAIEEYKTESERKDYLDAQHFDLTDALETLTSAIENIDKETRERFKDTYDQVNGGLQELFPKVFGGGSAYLELTGEDLLDTGIAIMARPPGKRNSTIHLLSGGEKALTAIALVFSIFRLNPAPFCMLDEVDAPLDDANVGRYARMVEEMSSQVQFIYITHNKIAMEMAHQLMGVTMHEPGVSRMVTVDVNEAAELAAV